MVITCTVLDVAKGLKASKKWKKLVNAVNKNEYVTLLDACITVVKKHGLYLLKKIIITISIYFSK